MPFASSFPPPAPEGRAATMALIEREWRQLEAALAGLTAEQIGTPGLTPEWRIQDALAHMAGWMRAAKDSIEIITSGRRWESHGVWRTIWLMWRLRFNYFCGATPESLHRAYTQQ